MIFNDIARYNKPLFILVVAFIIVQVYYNFRFAGFCYQIDRGNTDVAPVTCDAFPFVIYHMYSGKMNDWNHYSCLQIEADGQNVVLTDMPVIQEDQVLNPTGWFVDLQEQGFEDHALFRYLQSALNSSSLATKVYEKVSNQSLGARKDDWGRWLQRYLTTILKRDVHSIKVFRNTYGYSTAGKPQYLDQKLLYQYQ